jgi:DNA-binding transcriptional regulator YiaG
MKWEQQSIKSLREKLGLTQVEFARQLGCRQQTISEWELGIYVPGNAYGRLLDFISEGALKSPIANEVEKRIGEHALGARQVLSALD